VRWKVHLDSGPRTIDLAAFDLAGRLRNASTKEPAAAETA